MDFFFTCRLNKIEEQKKKMLQPNTDFDCVYLLSICVPQIFTQKLLLDKFYFYAGEQHSEKLGNVSKIVDSESRNLLFDFFSNYNLFASKRDKKT
jgi:hypothetical protein